MTDVLDKHNIRCCVSLNMAVLEHFPEIGEAMVQRDCDFMSHGIYNTRYLNSYTEEQEREFYRVNSGKLVSVPYSIELSDAPSSGSTTRGTTSPRSARPSSTNSMRRAHTAGA